MNIIQLHKEFLKQAKRKLREQCCAGSVHLTEALARGCGYNKNAALLADLRENGEGRYVLFDEAAFRERLSQLGGTAPAEIKLPDLGRSAYYVAKIFNDPDVEIIDLQPMQSRFRLAGIDTVVEINLEETEQGYTRFHRSHAIHTPSQLGPYWPSRDYDDDPAYAMSRAIDSIIDYYHQAVQEGHEPESNWLVKSRYLAA